MNSPSLFIQSIDIAAFEERIRLIVRTEVATLAPTAKEKKYLTRAEVCKRLRISLPTLGDYVKNGVIKGNKISRRVLFEESEVEAALKEIPNTKYSRTVRR